MHPVRIDTVTQSDCLDFTVPTPESVSAHALELEPVTVAVVGLGYVGLPTALGMLEAGSRVIGFDVSETRLSSIKRQDVDLIEADRVRLARFVGRTEFTLTVDPRSIAAADLIVVCVPTPVDEHLVPDLSILRGACASVVEHARPGQTIVLTSTTYVGSTRDLVVEPLAARGLTAGHDVHVAFSPERIDPGNPAHVPEHTPRVIGGVSTECTRRAVEVLERTSARMHPVSSPEAAEMTKLLENTFRAVNIAFANEFAGLARELDVDPIEVISAAATKPYGFMPFYPGPGVGGHCIPCDPHYLLWQLKTRRVIAPIAGAAMDAIAGRPRAVVSRAEQVLATHGRALRGSRVLIVGAAYKPGVADVRESPALEIIDSLHRAGSNVSFTDPLVATVRHGDIELTCEPQPADTDWDLVIVHTLHPNIDHSWLLDAPRVLDASYQLTVHPTRHLL